MPQWTDTFSLNTLRKMGSVFEPSHDMGYTPFWIFIGSWSGIGKCPHFWGYWTPPFNGHYRWYTSWLGDVQLGRLIGSWWFSQTTGWKWMPKTKLAFPGTISSVFSPLAKTPVGRRGPNKKRAVGVRHAAVGLVTLVLGRFLVFFWLRAHGHIYLTINSHVGSDWKSPVRKSKSSCESYCRQ